MELATKLLETLVNNTRPKREGHMFIVMIKSTHEEHLSQPLQTNNKQFKVAVTFLTGYNGIFNLTNSNIKFYFKKTITNEEGFIQIALPPGAYEIESLDKELKRIIVGENHFTQANYPFKIKPNFATFGSNIEFSPQGPIISFMFDVSMRDLLGFNAKTLYEEYNLSQKPVDIISFDNIFSESDIAKGMIFRGKRSGIIHNWSVNVNPGFKFIERFSGDVTWYMMESKDVISSISFKLKIENNELVSFNGQSITFRLSEYYRKV